MSDDPLRALATLALLHELADDAWREAVERGRAAVRPAASAGAQEGTARTRPAAAEPRSVAAVEREGGDAFLDALAALVADQKDRLKEEWARSRTAQAVRAEEGVSAQLEEMRFELGEIRGRLEAIESLLDGLTARLEAAAGGAGGRGRSSGRDDRPRGR